jgi:predicted membrane protein
MAAGELEVRGGAQNLLDASFDYNVASWKPDVQYRSSGGVGDLTVEQHGSASSGGNTKNRWDLKFSNDVSLDIRTEFGAGEARLNLGSLRLNSVDIQMGAGTLDLDLRGRPAKDYSVNVRGGVGEATIRLPKDVGVSAKATGGLGDISTDGFHKDGDKYVNDAYAGATTRIRLDIQGGVGTIRLISE